MAKKAKKTAPKKAKPVAKAKPIKKAKPAKTKVSKAKPTRKAAPKKAAPKKAVVVKAPKKAEIKVVVVKEKGKRGRKPAIKPEALTDNKKTAPDNFQLNIFPVSNARPIAHKQTKGAPVNDDKTRYSDAELKFFEELIYKKLDKARANPIKRTAGKPSKRVSRIATRIMVRMAGMGPYLTCLQK